MKYLYLSLITLIACSRPSPPQHIPTLDGLERDLAGDPDTIGEEKDPMRNMKGFGFSRSSVGLYAWVAETQSAAECPGGFGFKMTTVADLASHLGGLSCEVEVSTFSAEDQDDLVPSSRLDDEFWSLGVLCNNNEAIVLIFPVKHDSYFDDDATIYYHNAQANKTCVYDVILRSDVRFGE